MSSIDELQRELVLTYITQSVDALLLFDCIITLSQEVDVIWRQKWSMTTWLYLLTRYSTAMDQINLSFPDWNFVSCEVGLRIDEALQLVQFRCLAWFSTLRVYALSNGKWFIASVVLLLNLVPFATNVLNFVTVVTYRDLEACTAFSRLSDNTLLSYVFAKTAKLNLIIFTDVVSLATRISVIVGDVLVLAVTWKKSAHLYQEARRSNIRAPLATILIRDGTFYFIILLVINVIKAIQTKTPALLTLDVAQPFFNIIPSMIVYHFIISLRQSKSEESSQASGNLNQSHTLRFAEGMGGSLQFAWDDEDEEELPENMDDAAAETVDELERDLVPNDHATEHDVQQGSSAHAPV